MIKNKNGISLVEVIVVIIVVGVLASVGGAIMQNLTTRARTTEVLALISGWETDVFLPWTLQNGQWSTQAMPALQTADADFRALNQSGKFNMMGCNLMLNPPPIVYTAVKYEPAGLPLCYKYYPSDKSPSKWYVFPNTPYTTALINLIPKDQLLDAPL